MYVLDKRCFAMIYGPDELTDIARLTRIDNQCYEPAWLQTHPRLTTQAADGGSPTRCGYCGKVNVFCRQWVEGDDTDSTDYPNPARVYLCGSCVQHVMQPHPRMYVPAEDKL